MTVLYLSVRYVGIISSVINILWSLPSFSATDVGCNIMGFALFWTSFVVNFMLGVIMIIRLHAMYHRSRPMLNFLVAIFLAVTIACGAMSVIGSHHFSGEELVLSGTYQCLFLGGNDRLLTKTWMLNTVWEVLALCLVVWAFVMHRRDLRRPWGWITGECFKVYIKIHVLYFTAFVTVSCLKLGLLSPKILDSSSTGAQIYAGVIRLITFMQMFVMVPRLVLSVRIYHAKLVANSDEGTGMSTIDFQEHIQMSTAGSV